MEYSYRSRVVDKKITQYLTAFGAVSLEGPKWCGKTCSAMHHSKSSFFLGDPRGNFQNRTLAGLDPFLVLEGERPRLIDEWQEVPALWDAVRHAVDQDPEKGRFILTGSATPQIKGILHSGAGRIAKIRMRPMSLFESGDSSGAVSLESLCRGEITSSITGEVNLKDLITLVIRGGWPGSIGVPVADAAQIPGEYLNAIVEDDFFRMDGVRRDVKKMKRLLRSLARNESTTASNKTLLRDISAEDDDTIDPSTIAEYIGLFERMFLVENQLPFASRIRSSTRIKTAEKRHFSDPSLAAALLGATPEKLLYDPETLGFLFEALCERDLRIYAESMDAKLYHYQDYRNNEIDAVIEEKDGTWHAFEIKLGAKQIDEAAANLLRIKSEIEKDPTGKPPSVLCVITGLSNAVYRRADGVFVVPITALRA